MSAVKMGEWTIRPVVVSSAVDSIREKLEGVSSRLNAYYAGHSESVSTDEASSLRGEQKAYRIALQAIEAANDEVRKQLNNEFVRVEQCEICMKRVTDWVDPGDGKRVCIPCDDKHYSESSPAPTQLSQIGREALGPIVVNYEPFNAKSD